MTRMTKTYANTILRLNIIII